jgi:hypothetical protein
MLIASVGSGLAADLGFGTALAAEEPGRLTFGDLEPLVSLMQETPPAKILPLLTDRLRDGTPLSQLVAAAALANARTFGGDDYVGFHTMMALSPSYHMAQELPDDRRPLPVFKVLYRNSSRIQAKGGSKAEVLHPVEAEPVPEGRPGQEVLREQVRHQDLKAAEKTFATLAQGSPEDAFNQLLYMVEDGAEVHRVVMAYRAWDLLRLVGKERAHTMLRQSVHYCVGQEKYSSTYYAKLRAELPKLLDQYHLEGRPLGKRTAEDSWIDQMSQTLFKATAEQAADAAAAALADGMAPDALAEAVTLAANQLVLRDNGRPKEQTSPGKPVGSVHGDGIGVHACDSANAWRNIARASNPRNAGACLILAAWQVARDRSQRGGDFLHWEPYPRAEAKEKIKASDGPGLLQEAEAAIKANDQGRACAAVQRYADLGQPARPVMDLLLRYAISEDGALHAEKYYRTATEEFSRTRPAFRWRQLVALARVTASEYGQPAPGFDEACHLLKV